MNKTIVPPPLITSNPVFIEGSIIELANILKRILPEKGNSLRTIIVIPSNPIKNFLMQYITDCDNCFFGSTFMTLQKATDHLISISYPTTYRKPSNANLALFLESHLLSPCDELLPLISYLGKDKKKISSLAKKLSTIFLYYGVFGGKALEEWEEKEGWQQILWQKSIGYWDFPCKLLKKPRERHIPTNIILFDIPHIPPIFEEFLKSFSTKTVKISHLKNDPIYDKHLNIHEASSPLREIEILYDNLLNTLINESIFPEDIVVMAPDLNRYYPFIQFVFEQEGSQLGYSITNISALPYNHFFKSALHFFLLVESRFEKESILDLIFSKPIAKKQGFASQEYSMLRQMIDDMNIEWGFDAEMKREILDLDGISERGSWKFAFNKLLESLAVSQSIEISKFELLGNLIFFLETLFSDLRSLKNKEESLSNWIALLDELLHKYFEDCDDLEFLLCKIHSFTDISNDIHTHFPFSTVRALLIEILEKKTFDRTYSNNPIILFMNLSEGYPLSAKATFILGLDEDSFPGKNNSASLNELKGLDLSDHQPERSELDRFFFSRALFSAQGEINLSYTGLSESDGKPLEPSLVVQELRQTLNIPIKKHPDVSFTPKPKELISFSIRTKPEPPLTIDIRKIIDALKHPIKFYCNHILGLYLDRGPEKDSREFFLSYLDRSLSIDSFLKKDKDDIFENYEKTNLLPTALFQESAKQELLNELTEIELGLKTFGLSKNEFFSIHFDPACKAPFSLDANRYIHPPIITTLSSGIRYTLTGKLPSLAKQGVYIHKESGTPEIWKHLAHLSILNEIESPAEPLLLFGKDFRTKSLLFPLESLIEYYLQASSFPSPLIPEQIDKLIKKKEFSPISFFEDPYLTYLPPDLTKNWDNWLNLFNLHNEFI